MREKVSEQHADDPERWLALIHIEIESPEGTTSLKSRLPRYYIHLRDCYSLPVLPIVIYLKVGMDGIGVDHIEERFWESVRLAFDYLYVGLPGLNAIEYIQSDNWLGVALTALMRISPDQAAWLAPRRCDDWSRRLLPSSSDSCLAIACKPTCKWMNSSDRNMNDCWRKSPTQRC